MSHKAASQLVFDATRILGPVVLTDRRCNPSTHNWKYKDYNFKEVQNEDCLLWLMRQRTVDACFD